MLKCNFFAPFFQSDEKSILRKTEFGLDHSDMQNFCELTAAKTQTLVDSVGAKLWIF
jgi:hypothetical protein